MSAAEPSGSSDGGAETPGAGESLGATALCDGAGDVAAESGVPVQPARLNTRATDATATVIPAIVVRRGRSRRRMLTQRVYGRAPPTRWAGTPSERYHQARGIHHRHRRFIVVECGCVIEQRLQQTVQPLQAAQQTNAVTAHYDAIYAAHKDADEIVESAEFAAWRDNLPAFAKAGVEHALTKGAAKDVIEVFDAFRGTKPQQPSTARTAPEAPARRVPNSLSDVPGAAPMDKTQQILAAAGNAEALLDSMGSLTPEQRDALLDNLI